MHAFLDLTRKASNSLDFSAELHEKVGNVGREGISISLPMVEEWIVYQEKERERNLTDTDGELGKKNIMKQFSTRVKSIGKEKEKEKEKE